MPPHKLVSPPRGREGRTSDPENELQAGFDPLPEVPGTKVHTIRRGDRVVRYIDEGDPAWRPMVFFGGLGTSVRAFELTEFARTMRERLRLRAISVERNGFGETPFDPSLGIGDVVDDVLCVLDLLGIAMAVVVAFSGGGPYAAALAARVPERLTSLHLAAAAAGSLVARSSRASEIAQEGAKLARDPSAFWGFPADSPVHLIPGFDEAAAAEGVRALGRDGRGAAALAHEWWLLGGAPLPSLESVSAPAYLYWGTGDEIVPPAHAGAWREALGGEVVLRRYDGEAHDVQYRHWDQILLDAAGLGARTLICHEGAGVLVGPDELERMLCAGATLGLCAWATAPMTRNRDAEHHSP
jgi:non-heme chloroperoxidase